jgi:CheY-like chemotaxis protein
VASTLLAVDDSVTMRKVLEITFAGQDYRVVTVNSADAALQKLKSDKPDLVIADGTLEQKNGYDLCKEIKKLAPSTPVLFLSSKQNPFDAAKGSGAQVDDHMDKPFDTQQMIDKVKKLLANQPAAKTAAPTVQSNVAAAPPPAQPAAAAAAPPAAPAAARTAQGGITAPSAAAAAAPPAANPQMQRAKTLIYNPPAPTGPAAPPAAAPAKPAAAPTPAAAAPRTPTPEPPGVAAGASAAVSPAAAHVNGQMAGKLEQLGLTPAQIEAVLTLSREVVERVVWEVVPVLAESLIREEIARLTK